MNSEPNNATSTAALAGKYLVFVLANEEYGLPVLRVREIIRMMDITEVPRVPEHIKGVLNLRGNVIPVIDLRIKLGFAGCEPSSRTCIVVVETVLSSGRVMMGIIADRVSEVLNIVADEIQQPPEFGDGVCTGYMKGVARVKGSVKILLDLDRVLGTDDAPLRAA